MPNSLHEGKVYELNCPECRKNPIIEHRAFYFALFYSLDSASSQVTERGRGN